MYIYIYIYIYTNIYINFIKKIISYINICLIFFIRIFSIRIRRNFYTVNNTESFFL